MDTVSVGELVSVFSLSLYFSAPVVFHCYFFPLPFPLQSLSGFICVVVVVIIIILFIYFFIFTDAVFVYSLL